MVTTVTGTEQQRAVRTKKGIGLGPHPPGGNGSRKNGGGGDRSPGGGGEEGERWSPDRYRIGVYVGLASIVMMFTALASAYIVRAGLPTSTDWRPTAMPSVVVVSTVLIVISSLTMMLAQKSLGRGDEQPFRRWLALTLLLGLAFLGSQLLAWRQLVAQGVYLATNPHSSFFYVLTGLHGLHLLGGILGLSYLLLRAARGAGGGEAGAKRRAVSHMVGVYWHFMDGLWVFLFMLLFFWR
ncbi:MAG TPA: cytochrome c oxidase subunit 3 [Pyrinomonadaceae bacterium]